MAKLPPRQRQRLRQKAQNQAALQEAGRQGPTIADLQQEKRGLQRERASFAPAVQMARNAIGNTSTQGLKGPYKRDLQRELRGRSKDLNRSLPFLRADVNQQIADLNVDIGQAQRARAVDEQAAFQDLKAQAVEKKFEYDSARSEAHRLARAYVNELPSNKDEWVLFAKEVSKAEGVGIAAARKAVEELRAQLRKRPSQVVRDGHASVPMPGTGGVIRQGG